MPHTAESHSFLKPVLVRPQLALVQGSSFSPLGTPVSDEETEAGELTNTKQKSMIQLGSVDGVVEWQRVHPASRGVQ